MKTFTVQPPRFVFEADTPEEAAARCALALSQKLRDGSGSLRFEVWDEAADAESERTGALRVTLIDLDLTR
jgi:hypothetical protein